MMMMLFGDSHTEYFKFLPTSWMLSHADTKPNREFLCGSVQRTETTFRSAEPATQTREAYGVRCIPALFLASYFNQKLKQNLIQSAGYGALHALREIQVLIPNTRRNN
jgi:hypothetical protein